MGNKESADVSRRKSHLEISHGESGRGSGGVVIAIATLGAVATGVLYGVVQVAEFVLENRLAAVIIISSAVAISGWVAFGRKVDGESN